VPVSGSEATIFGGSSSRGPPVGDEGVAHEYAIAQMPIKREIRIVLIKSVKFMYDCRSRTVEYSKYDLFMIVNLSHYKKV
jgi:hypothetical protein